MFYNLIQSYLFLYNLQVIGWPYPLKVSAFG
jgi:hypothetical protein